VKLVALVLLLLFLAACQGNGAKDQPQAIPAETTASTATTVAPTTTKPNGLGVTQNYREVDPDTGNVYTGRVTVFRYRDASILTASAEAQLAKKKKKRSVGVEARVCVTKSPPPPADPTTLSWLPWGMGDNAGESHPSDINLVDDMTLEPQYPNFLTTPAGRCRRGWIGFVLPRNWHPDFVEYTAGGQYLSWPIQR
jgi:hypothetical protein